MNKRIASFVLAVCMLCVSGISFAAETEHKETQPSKTYEILSRLGLVTFDAEDLESNVKNEDFAMSMAYVSGITNDAFDETALATLTETGYMLMASSAPNADIKQICAVKAAVSLLGYDLDAQYSGGYPVGYLSAASQIGLLDNISYHADEPLSNRQFCELLYNSLLIDMKERVEYGSQAKYEVRKGKNFLNQNLDIIKSKGRVTANEYTNLSSGYRMEPDYIEVDGTAYICSDNYNELIGHNIMYFYRENDGARGEVLYMEADVGRENTLYVSSDDFISLTGNILSYYNVGGRKKELRLNKSYIISYNGKALLDYSLIDGINKEFFGSITAVDSDLDGNYDFLNIKNENTVFVGFIDYNEACIYDKYDANNHIKYDVSESDYAVYYSADGTETEAAKIKNGNVLSVMKSEDGTLYIINVGTESVSGSIDVINAAREEVILDEKTYKYAKNVKSDIEKLSPGDEIKAYLDVYGRIGGFEKILPDYVTGFVQKVVLKDYALSNEVKLKMYTSDAAFEEMTVSEKVYIDGIKYNSNEKIYEKLWNKTSNLPNYEYIMAEKNSAGEVAQITTCDDTEKLFNIFDSEKTTAADKSHTYYSSPVSVDGRFLFSGTCKIYMIPADDRDNDELYGITTSSALIAGRSYNVSAYTSGKEDFTASAVLVRQTKLTQAFSAQASSATNYAMFKGFSESLRDDGEVITNVIATVIATAKDLEIPVYSKSDVAELQDGDIFRFSTNVNGYMNYCFKIYDAEDGMCPDSMKDMISGKDLTSNKNAVQVAYNSTAEYGYSAIKYGRLAAISADGICITGGNTLPSSDLLDVYNEAKVYSLKGAPAWAIYHTEAKNNIIEASSAQSAKSYMDVGADCDQIMMVSYEGKALFVVMFRK